MDMNKPDTEKKHQKHCRASLGFVCSCLPDVIDFTVKTEEFTPTTPDTEEKCKVCKGTGWNPEKTMFAEFCSACDDDDYKTTPDTVCTNYMQEIPCKCECHNSNLQLCSMCCHHHGYIWHEEHKQAVSSRDTYWKERMKKVRRDLKARMAHEDYEGCVTCDETLYHLDTLLDNLK